MDLLDTRLSIGHLTCPMDPMDERNVQWTNGVSNYHFDYVCMRENIIPFDLLASSPACCSEAKASATGICPLNSKDALDTRMSNGHVTHLVDPMNEWNVQWTNRVSKRNFDRVCMELCSESLDS